SECAIGVVKKWVFDLNLFIQSKYRNQIALVRIGGEGKWLLTAVDTSNVGRYQIAQEVLEPSGTDGNAMPRKADKNAALRSSDAVIDRLARKELVDLNDANRKLHGTSERSVCGSVVDHDDFNVFIGLAEDTTQTSVYPPLLILSSDD